jgi:hypothetical protein
MKFQSKDSRLFINLALAPGVRFRKEIVFLVLLASMMVLLSDLATMAEWRVCMLDLITLQLQ